LNEKNDELDSLATSRLTDIKKKDEDIVNLNNTIEEINKQLSEISEKHHNLVFNYDELTDKHNLLTEQFADLESEYNNSEDLRKSYTEATTKLNDEVSRLQDIIVSKDAAYKNLESTYNDAVVEHVRDVNALKHTIEQLKSELTSKDEKLTKALAEVGTLTRKLDVASGKVEEAKTKAEVAVTTIKKKLQALNDGLGDEFNIFG
jgi:chromosome segregation ATPase